MTLPQRARARGQRGVVILLLLFLAAVVLIGSAAAALRLVTEGRRQKEEELVWRGEQYVRAIRLYYRKYGQFPKSFEDFSKNSGRIHFLRKEYKDPMNAADGSWRYIYVGPTGQLMGSLTRSLPIGMVPITGLPGAPGTAGPGTTGSGAGAPGSSGFGGGATAGGSAGGSGFSLGGMGSGASGAGGNASGSAGGSDSGAAPGGQTTQDSSSAPSSIIDATTGLPVDYGAMPGSGLGQVQPPKHAIKGAQTLDSPVFGGQLVGIGSKIDRRSILFYKGYGKYREWEFIWDPAEEAAAAGGAPVGGGILPAGIGATPTGPTGNSPQSPGNPPPTGGTPPPQ